MKSNFGQNQKMTGSGICTYCRGRISPEGIQSPTDIWQIVAKERSISGNLSVGGEYRRVDRVDKSSR